MKGLEFFGIVLLFSLVPMSAYPTTIVVVSRNGSIYIGVDSLRSSSTPGKKSETVCKLKDYGGTLATHYGTASLYFLVENGNGQKRTKVYDADDFARRAALAPGTLEDKADYLEKQYWLFYTEMIKHILGTKDTQMRQELSEQFFSAGFVIAGKGKSGLPEAIVLQFITDFHHSDPHPTKIRWSVPGDGAEGFVGVNDIRPGPDLFAAGAVPGINKYLALESSSHPSGVGPPFAIVRIDGDKFSFEQLGACGKSQSRKLTYSAP